LPLSFHSNLNSQQFAASADAGLIGQQTAARRNYLRRPRIDKHYVHGDKPGAINRGCPSPKHHPACLFNDFLRPPAARSDDATLRLRRSQSPVRTPVVALLSAPAHPYIKINVPWNRGTTTRYKTHSTELEVYYPWHPWFGLKVTTNRPFTRRGVARVYATGESPFGRRQSLASAQ
jgi:hypothetical protein